MTKRLTQRDMNASPFAALIGFALLISLSSCGGGSSLSFFSQTFEVRDPYHQQMPIVSYEIPGDWAGVSSVEWSGDNMLFPASVHVRMQNPEGSEAIEIYPVLSFFWLEIPQATAYLKAGKMYNGSLMQRVTDPGQTLIQHVIQPARGKAPGFRIVETKKIANLSTALNVPTEAPIPGVSVEVEYQQDGKAIRERFYSLFIDNPVPTDMGVQHNWYFAGIHSLKAPADELAAKAEAMQRILRDRKENAQWTEVHQAVAKQVQDNFNRGMAQGYENIAAAGRLSRQISANNDAMLQGMQQRREQQNGSSSGGYSSSGSGESSVDGFGNYIRDEETYQDPYWGTSQQSSNYSYIWTDGFGNYRYSNDIGFDPNLQSNQNWSLMKKK
ncbi:MAG: hypothetical protein EAZ89_01915 [Bacteroidetes bacterium]|nr:MAG: hypothetical protein EAZ89_01915 [Bacteroidota bacterium]